MCGYLAGLVFALNQLGGFGCSDGILTNCCYFTSSLLDEHGLRLCDKKAYCSSIITNSGAMTIHSVPINTEFMTTIVMNLLC